MPFFYSGIIPHLLNQRMLGAKITCFNCNNKFIVEVDSNKNVLWFELNREEGNDR